MMIGRTETILQNEGSHTNRVEPLGDRSAFMICQVAVAASRTNDDGCARGFVLWREVRSQRRNIGWGVANGAGSAGWPKHDWCFWSCIDRQGVGKKNQHKKYLNLSDAVHMFVLSYGPQAKLVEECPRAVSRQIVTYDLARLSKTS